MLFLGLVLIGALSYFEGIPTNDKVLVGLLMFTALAMLIAVFIAFINRPLEYILTTSKIIIGRQGRKPLHYHLEKEGKEIYIVSAKDLQKQWGSSGFFGYFGMFSHHKLGKVRLLSSSRTGIALILTTEGWLGISPSKQFLQQLRSLPE
ncbi:MAG: hypothetical protein DDT42_02022 [candidate division WS2 bacterium]|uniref:Bacterial Pleckstrin homology domain-containing protein n=1 Tax=Psychracetigena formicireducens TaxID=2986056 RepID=A0A9E2BKD1_PSYF1|nr:hypothetical protein [Candidatus Psychracetigena formicireducens]